MSKENKRALKYVIFTALFFVSALAAIIIILFPLILSYPKASDAVSSIARTLKNETYKGEYFSAVGGLVGSFLAVTSAILVQYTSEEKQRKEQLESEQKQEAARMRKYATIVYYDIKFFYEEMTPFLLAAKASDSTHKKGFMKLDKKSTSNLMRERKNILIDQNWIVDTAELAHKLSSETIKDIYTFYGAASNLMTAINNTVISRATYDDIRKICSLACELGEFTESKNYNAFKKYGGLLNTLSEYMTDKERATQTSILTAGDNSIATPILKLNPEKESADT